MKQPPVEYAPAASLAEHYWLKIGTIYALANKHHWRKIKVGRQVRYHIQDAVKDLEPGRTRRLRAVLDKRSRS